MHTTLIAFYSLGNFEIDEIFRNFCQLQEKL
jgi:hypothetical protein